MLTLSSIVKVEITRLYNGIQVLVTFTNGYTASVIEHDGSYGVELAVMHTGVIVYDTPVADDVMGHLDQESLTAALLAVSHLPKRY